MDALNIIVFSLNETPSGKLKAALPGLNQNNFFSLPESVDQSFSENEAVKYVLEHTPEMALIEIDQEYPYQDFIKCFQDLCAENTPQIIAVLGGKHDQQKTLELTQLNIEDYIFSDWSSEQIQTKLEKLNKLHLYHHELREQANQSTEAAMTAMKAASEVGLLMQLVEWLQAANDLEEVANSLFKLCSSLELNAVALIVDNQQRDFFPQGIVPASVMKIMTEAHQSNVRVLSKNRIQVFRLDYLVLMITNAPWQEEEKYGRYRDILLQAAALAEAKARTITVNNLISSQHNKVGTIMDLIKNLSADTQKYTREIMQNLSDDLAMSALSLDLNEEQETRLLELSAKAHDSIEVLYDSNDALESHFHELISSITAVRELTESKKSEADDNEEAIDDDEITLF